MKNWLKNGKLRNGLVSGAYWLTLLTILELLLHILAYGAPALHEKRNFSLLQPTTAVLGFATIFCFLLLFSLISCYNEENQ